MNIHFALVLELADRLDSGSSVEKRGGSTPPEGTKSVSPDSYLDLLTFIFNDLLFY